METAPETIPFHLRGPYAPVLEEHTLFELEVVGQVPHDLRGLYLRNGPNPRRASPAWFVGEGMLHGVRLDGGRACWYRNRWMQCAHGPNTSVVPHGGRILALVETQPALEVDAELGTVGSFDFGGLTGPMGTAHPKRCPTTGELLFVSCQKHEPYLTFHRVDATGRLVHRAPISVPAPTYVHDIAITERFVLVWDLPIIAVDFRSQEMPYRWVDDYRPRIGILPRDGHDQDVRWFDVAPCTISHTMNAFEEGRRVILDVVRGPRAMAAHALHRYTFDLDSGRVTEAVLEPRFVDFPRVAPAYEGRPYRYGYAVEVDDWSGFVFHRTVSRKYDLTTGQSWTHDFGRSRLAGEWEPVPRAGATAEDDAWAISFVYDQERGASDLVILDARRFDEPPVATVRLPCRVPIGIHGAWVPDNKEALIR
jgi:carotenoid cleavage dioxygenase